MFFDRLFIVTVWHFKRLRYIRHLQLAYFCFEGSGFKSRGQGGNFKLLMLLQFLEHYKLELARRRFGPATAEKGAGGEEPPAKKPRMDLDRPFSGQLLQTDHHTSKKPWMTLCTYKVQV